MSRDVFPGAPTVISPVKAAHQTARFFNPFEPAWAAILGQIACADFQSVVEVAFRHHYPPGHKEFAYG